MKRPFPVRQLVLVGIIAAIGIAAAFGIDVNPVCAVAPELCGAVKPSPATPDGGP